ncbi:hypothetical protein PINS_up015872 [Pythium insidiosum]|nr:hypothetical protein PINS_up015872 [Pythium insidiosum]
MLAVVPLPKSEKEDWMVVAANSDQLLARSLKSFLHRNNSIKEHASVKRGLRSALKAMGERSSSSGSDDEESSSDSDGDLGDTSKKVSPARKKQEMSTAPQPTQNKTLQQVPVRNQLDTTPQFKEKDVALTSPPPSLPEVIPVSVSRGALKGAPILPSNVVTPTRKSRLESTTPKDAVPSPVVSISSPSSASSAPNTPDHVRKLSDSARRALVLSEIEWTPVNKSSADGSKCVVTSGALTVEHEARSINIDHPADQEAQVLPSAKAGKKSRKPGKKVPLALFVNDDDDMKKPVEELSSSVSTSTISETLMVTSTSSSTSKRGAENELEDVRPTKKQLIAVDGVLTAKNAVADVEMQPSNDDDCTDVDEEVEFSPAAAMNCIPLDSDGGLLINAAAFLYEASEDSADKCAPVIQSKHSSFSASELDLLYRFSHQLNRLRMDYDEDRTRILRQYSLPSQLCECGASKKKPSVPSASINWRKLIASHASKRKHMKRRTKKQLIAKLKDLDDAFAAKVRDARLIQRLELQSLQARLELDALMA